MRWPWHRIVEERKRYGLAKDGTNILEWLEHEANHTECNECGQQIKIIFPDSFNLENGTYLNLGGSYGMFLDVLDQHADVVLCHDCTIKLLEALPTIAAQLESKFGNGWHPYEGDTPCCKYGWTFTEEKK